MAVEGKKLYKFYLTPEHHEVVKEFVVCTRKAGGMSSLVDEVLGAMAETLKASGVGKKPMNYAKVIRLFIEGIKRA